MSPVLTGVIEQLLDVADPADRTGFLGQQFDLGLAWVWFPEGMGGRGLDKGDQRIVRERLAAAGAPRPVREDFLGHNLAAPTLVAHADPTLASRLLRDTFVGTVRWCQLFSEPGAGSDLAALGCRAVRDGDEWVVNGQKVWTSVAVEADRAMLLARTTPGPLKHRGITYFALDMHSPGVEVRPLRQMTGDAEFNEVFLTDVRVPEVDRVGDVDDGWRIAMTTLTSERSGLSSAGSGSGAIAEVLRIVRARDTPLGPVERARVTRVWVDAEICRINSLRSAALRQSGAVASGSTGKLRMAELNQDLYSLCVDLLGADGQVGFDYSMRTTEMLGLVGPPGQSRRMFLRSRANSIEGGTSEIQRNIIAERVLGLPPEPRLDNIRTTRE